MKFKLNYKSDTDWNIQEFDDSDKQIGYDYKPAEILSIRFKAKSFILDKTFLYSHAESESENRREVIRVTLTPRSRSECYFFGSQESVEIYSLQIFRKSFFKKSKSKDTIRNHIASGYSLESFIQISTSIDDSDFDWLMDKIQNKLIQEMYVELHHVPGFYNSYDDFFKVFPNDSDTANLIVDDNIEFRPPSANSYFDGGIDIQTITRFDISKYPQEDVDKIVDKVIDHPRISGVLQTIKYSIFAILIILFIESIKNNYFS